ncbi:MmgE/PrpD family protein [Allopusillimonas ginsengisoli]|nr:MmgE/PrpD family protein [Allopusillimonas ginsengisoli]
MTSVIRQARPAPRAVTMELAARVPAYQFDSLPADIIELVRQCIVDWFSVTLAALDDPVHHAMMRGAGQPVGSAHIIGHADMYPIAAATLVNGTTAHALDFDDVNLAISGHPSAVIFSALLALAEQEGSSGQDVISAFVAGYETACRVGRLVCPDHLNRGFHATGTVGGFGAAAACAHLLKFDATQTARALGIAGTQASGLKAMFGTMVKPLHAGLAARSGLEAALFVLQGVDSRTDILECALGFAHTHSSDFNVATLDEEPTHFYLRNNLFKYDASCYGTYAAIECVRQLKTTHGFSAAEVDTVRVRADRSVNELCNIQRPLTGLQGKFSLRLNTAFALLGVDTGLIESYSDDAMTAQHVVALRDRVSVELVDDWPSMQSEVTIRTKDGQQYVHTIDGAVSDPDVAAQGRRIDDKFARLAGQALGGGQSQLLLAAIQTLEHASNVRVLAGLCTKPS